MEPAVLEQIRTTIKETVNGKIDAMRDDLNTHNAKHEGDMERIMPIIEAYETAQGAGRIAMKSISILTAIGGAWLVVRSIWPS